MSHAPSVGMLGSNTPSAAPGAHGARRMTAAWSFTPIVDAVPVTDISGHLMRAPWLGGFDVPRPQLVDIRGTGHPDLFVQEWQGRIMYFERTDTTWTWRSDRYQDLDVGEWYRFVDVDADGRIDLLTEMPQGYIRLFRNVGTKQEAKFAAVADTIRDVDGLAILADRQNILNAVDIDCNGKLDLFIGRVQGTVDRFEQDGTSPGGAPRFRLIAPNWEGIEILGPEATGGSAVARPISDTGAGAESREPGVRLESGDRLESPDRLESSVELLSARGSMRTRASRRTQGPRLSARSLARHGANTLTFADVSGKGVLDLFWGDFFEAGLLQIENSGSCAQPNLQHKPVEFPPGKPLITSGYNAPTFGDVDGDGNLDLVMGVIGGAYSPARTSIDNLYLMMQAPRGNWTLKTKRLITQIDVGADAVPVLADLRGSGKLDLLVGSKILPSDNSSGSITWFENTGTAAAPAFRERGVLPINGHFNYAVAVADLDNDGLPDLVIGTWRDRIQWYRNTGTRAEPKWSLADSALITIPRGSNTVPTVGDVDGDGLLDIIIGTATGRMLLYRNTGTKTAPNFTMVTASIQDIKSGRRAAPTLFDVDGDGRLDVLLGNDAGDVQLWRNVTTTGGEFRIALDSSFVMHGLSNAAPAAGRLHGDAKLDVLVGTGAGGVRWYKERL